MVGDIVGSASWAIVAVIVLIVSFLATYWILIHEPRARVPRPGHPAYEGDEDDDD